MEMKFIEKRCEEDSFNEQYIQTVNGFLAFECPKCGNINFKRVYYKKVSKWVPNILCPREIYDIRCGICQNEFTTEAAIDPNIVQAVIDLNRLGYRTIACCEGHTYSVRSDYPDNGYTYVSERAYIGFEDHTIKEDHPDPPEGWHWGTFGDEQENLLIFYDPYIEFHTDYVEDDSWKIDALKALYAWVHVIWCSRADEYLASP